MNGESGEEDDAKKHIFLRPETRTDGVMTEGECVAFNEKILRIAVDRAVDLAK